MFHMFRRSVSSRLTGTGLGVLALLLLSTPAGATTIVPMSFSEMVDASLYIVKGKVVSAEVRQDPDNGNIFTHFSVKVLDKIKGDPGDEVSFRVLGGSLEGRTCHVHGLRLLKKGRTYILGLSDEYQRVANPYVGVNQGWFEILKDPSTGRESVVNADNKLLMGVENGVLRYRFSEVEETRAEKLSRMANVTGTGASSDGAEPQIASGELERQAYWDTSRPGMSPEEFIAVLRQEVADIARTKEGK